VIVADTSAIVALIDRDDHHHQAVRALYEQNPDAWVIPWAVLPEADYLIGNHLGAGVQEAFVADLASGGFTVEWGEPEDLERASELGRKHRALRLGLVDGVVMAVAERLGAEAIATLDLRHFGAVKGMPKLFPRDAG